jgi:hypothetical protein
MGFSLHGIQFAQDSVFTGFSFHRIQFSQSFLCIKYSLHKMLFVWDSLCTGHAKRILCKEYFMQRIFYAKSILLQKVFYCITRIKHCMKLTPVVSTGPHARSKDKERVVAVYREFWVKKGNFGRKGNDYVNLAKIA